MNKYLNSLFVLIYSLANVLGLGQVICRGADGHVAIEKPHESNHCSSEHDADHAEEELSSKASDACEPCVDSPLQDDNKISSHDQKVFKYGTLESISIKVPFSIGVITPIIDLPKQHKWHNQDLESLRTIVLII